jgi:hypothetical protein
MKNRDKMQSLHNVSEVFAFLFSWVYDQPENELYFKEVVSMLEKQELDEVMKAMETVYVWIGEARKEKDYDRNETNRKTF